MYIDNYFNEVRFNLCPIEKKMLKKIYKIIANLKCSYEKSVCWLLDYGCYSKRPIESILAKLDKMVKVYLYYGEKDWMESKTTKLSLEKLNLDIPIEYIPASGHVFMIENPFCL